MKSTFRIKSILTMLIFISLFIVTTNNSIQAQDNKSVSGLKSADIASVSLVRELLITDSGHLTVLGQTSDEDGFISRFDSQGNELWSWQFGGSANDIIDHAVQYSDSNIFVVGVTESDDFPVLNAHQAEFGGIRDAFLMKFNDDGELLWSTYLGGSGSDELNTYHDIIFFDGDGNILVWGFTNSPNFYTQNAVQSSLGTVNPSEGTYDFFITKFSPDGEILWSTYWGGDDTENGEVSLDSDGQIRINGMTHGGLITKDGFQSALAGEVDKFHASLDNDGQLIWSTYLGGSGHDALTYGADVLDSQNNIYSLTTVNSVDFPVSPNAVQSSYGGGSDDVQITKISPQGGKLWSTYVGGGSSDAVGMTSQDRVANQDHMPSQKAFPVIDSNDNLIFYSKSTSKTMNLTKIGTYTQSPGFDNIAPYLIKLNANGSLGFGTYLAGSSLHVFAGDPVVDSNDNILVAGSTTSDDYPIVNAEQSTFGGVMDVYASKISPSGEVLWSTYLGGSGDDRLVAMRLDQNDDIYLMGTTLSDDFPVEINRPQNKDGLVNSYQGNQDGFIAKYDTDGQLIWSAYIGSSGQETFSRYSLTFDSDDDVYITGVTTEDIFGGNAKIESGTGFISQIGGDGEALWSHYVGPYELENEQKEDYTLLIIIVTSITMIGVLSYGTNKYLLGNRGKDLLINEKMDKILAPIFSSNSSFMYLFVGQSLIKDKHVQQDVKKEVPEEIYSFKDFLHPVRLSMIKVLYDNTTMTTIDLKDTLGIDWGEFSNHLNALKKRGYLTTEQTFVEENVRTIVSVVPTTVNQFQNLRDLLVEFLRSSPNLDQYLENVMAIKHREEHEDLYPNSN